MSLKVDIIKRYKGFSLEVNFSSNGKPLGMLGASGSGKSMTLKCIAGIITPDEGVIILNDHVLFDSTKKINLKPQKRNVGYLFQSFALFPNMTVEDNILCAFKNKQKSHLDKVRVLLHAYQLEGLEKRYPSQLSGGQQQRVALVRMLAYEPAALLLDEPFSTLDTSLKETLQHELKNLLKIYHGDVIMVTHNRDEVYKICDDLLVISQGQAIAYDQTKALFSKPKLVDVARLTGCKNILKAVKKTQSSVYCVDLGIELDVILPIPTNLSHIGIHAHDFTPDDGTGKNSVSIKSFEIFESPLFWNVVITNTTAEDNKVEIRWQYPKSEVSFDMPKFIAIRPSDILLLTR